METKRYLMIAITLVMALLLAACVRPASESPSENATPTTVGDFPLPGTNDDVMSELEKAATQTLMAMQGSGTPIPTEIPPTESSTGEQAPTATLLSQDVQATVAAAAVTGVPTAVSFPTATPGIPTSWTLQAKEFPYCIARRFDVNPNEMLRLSGLSTNSTYYAGMVLKIPQTGNKFPGNTTLLPHPDTYTVRSGDTIYSIACKYGDADPYAIAAANGLASPYHISPGQTLQIP
jgi:LysM repeat protein